MLLESHHTNSKNLVHNLISVYYNTHEYLRWLSHDIIRLYCYYTDYYIENKCVDAQHGSWCANYLDILSGGFYFDRNSRKRKRS